MKSVLTVLYLLSFSILSFSQKTIVLPENNFQISGRKFYVTELIDKRKNKDFIGEIWLGTFKKPEKITVEGGVYSYLNDWFRLNFSKTSDEQMPVKVLIKYITIEQSGSYSKETGKAYVGFEIVDVLNDKYNVHSEIEEETDDAFSSHPQRLLAAFQDCMRKLNNEMPNNTEQKDDVATQEDAVEIVFDNNQSSDAKKYVNKPEKIRRAGNRNIIAVGYQIGGYNLIGVDYEVRVHDYFGVHFGAGFIGFTGGIKIHTNPKKNSMFFNLSWKDAGIGMMNGVALEAGGRWIWAKRRDFGLYYQAGFFALNHINDDYAALVYGSSSVPQVMFSTGLGLSW